MNENINLIQDKISFIFSDEDIVIVTKKSGIPSAPLKSSETNNALFFVSKKFPQILAVKNSYKEIEGGLLHRIDTETEGLLLFALNDFAWQNLYNQQKENKFVKEYTAFCSKNLQNAQSLLGFPEYIYENLSENKNNILIKSKFRNYGPERKQVRPVLENENTYAQKKASNKLYSTEILQVKKLDSVYKINCKISSGFRHQVRCHLAWAGFPIINDKIYNSNFVDNNSTATTEKLQFYATKLEFYHPRTNQLVNFSIDV